jgi:nicotinamidase-related amidase
MIAERYLSERDKRMFADAGYGRKTEPGGRPAFLAIDFTYEFVGPDREPVEEAVKKTRSACGLEAWAAVDACARLLPAVRRAGAPVLYTVMDRSIPGPFARKNARSGEPVREEWLKVVAEIAPAPGDVVLGKIAPSAFFGTNLIYTLLSRGIDTLFVTGGVTSGCVRCTVVDAFSYGFKVYVVQDAVFDRGEASGAISLFDMNAKYADVISEAEAYAYFASLAS